MSHDLPALLDLPPEVPETAIWPELSAALGSDGDGIGPATTIATLHCSALYESHELSPIASSACLSLFEGVGEAVLELELRLAIGRRDLADASLTPYLADCPNRVSHSDRPS